MTSVDPFKLAKWVVVAGRQDPRQDLILNINTRYAGRMRLNWSYQSEVRTYSQLRGENLLFQAKCNFAKINGYTICLIQAMGRYSDINVMMKYIGEACGFPSFNHHIFDVDCLLTLIGFVTKHVQLAHKQPKEQRPHYADFDSKTRGFIDKTDFIVHVGGDFTRDNLVGHMKLYSGVFYELLQHETVCTYQTLSPVDPTNDYSCTALCKSGTINDIPVAFFRACSNFGDNQSLLEMVKKWCPQAERVSTEEDLQHLMSSFATVTLKASLPYLLTRELTGQKHRN